MLFEIAGSRYGIPIEDVDEILRAVTLTPLPRAPRIVEGAINVRGAIVPVLDIRSRFRLPGKPVEPDDDLILARAGERRVAIRADHAEDFAEIAPSDVADAATLGDKIDYVAGIAKLPGGLVLIHDLKTFLTASEAADVDDAIAGAVE